MDQIDPMMLELFRTELENHSRLLEAGLVGAETDPAPERIEPLMRAAHSIKGAARIVGLPAAVTLAHAMEDILSAAQHGKLCLVSGHVDLLLKGNDIFQNLSRVETTDIPQQLQEQQNPIEELASAIRNSLNAPPVDTRPEKAAAGLAAGTVEELPGAAPASAVVKAPEPSKPEEPHRRENEQAPVKRKSSNTRKTDGGQVRVMSESMDRLMGLAGELLVQSQTAGSFNGSILKLKREAEAVRTQWQGLLETQQDNGISWDGPDGAVLLSERIEALQNLISGQMVAYDRYSRRLEHLTHRLYAEAVGSRMVPFADGLHGFLRLVRDLAQELGKQVNFQILGDATPVDRDILEKLEAPLSHLLRNAVDHGLETRQERTVSGKAATGSIVLDARHVAGMLNISLTDDGRGLDPEAIRRKVVEKGFATQEMAAALNRTELFEFLFLPGFSTTHQVTEISGRGVGLDVVFSMAQEVGGVVRVESEYGKRTSFILQLPLTLSVLRTLIVEVEGEPYALPLSRIDRLLRIPPESLQTLEDRQFCTADGEHIGIVSCRQLFQAPPAEGGDGAVHVVVISDRLNRYGLAVDSFRGEETVVVRPLDARLGKTPNIQAAAVLQDGAPVLILDIDDLVRSIHNLLNQGKLNKMVPNRVKGTIKKRILVVDDSLTVREVERKLLEREGYSVTSAVDGMDGWNALLGAAFDLVVSDVDMPRMNGIELVRKIKEHAQFRFIPVMIVSYKDSEEDRLRGLEAGANYYLTKGSFHDETLLNAVKDLIGNP